MIFVNFFKGGKRVVVGKGLFKWVDFKYEKFFDFCYLFGSLGNLVKDYFKWEEDSEVDLYDVE